MAGLAVVDNRVFAESELDADLGDHAAQVLGTLERHGLSPPGFAPVGPWRAPGAGAPRPGLPGRAALVGQLGGGGGRRGDGPPPESEPEGFTVSEARQALGISRKYALPLLTYFDATGITRRQGDRRVAGARLLRRP